MEHPSPLRSLTPELLVHALSFADAVSLLAASRACAALRAAANEEQVWTALLWRHHSRILRLLFHGQPPRENDGSLAKAGLLRVRSLLEAPRAAAVGSPPPKD
mmetsp:Transcript_3152/g.10226  ORF Transcript_3152/g.10226 Transcript_3152/m.10226 type:complete len:103 (-) Transcript_3152:270-578(-)